MPIQVTADPVVRVARDLRAIVAMVSQLEDQAIAKANDRMLPGGLAMVALGAVAAPSDYAEALEYAEHHALAGVRSWPEVEDDDDWEPPLQSLLFWSEAWREEHGYPMPARPTEATEANFLRWALEWAWDNEPHWDDFAGDVRKVVTRLEGMLLEGARPVFRGVPCLYDECRGKRLVRKTVPARDKDGNKVWRLTEWHCPRCHREWSEEDYARNVYAAVERQHWIYLGDTQWATVDRAARRVGRPQGTVRSWVSRGEVAAICINDGQRRTMVLVADVVARDNLALERRRRWETARRAKRMTSV